MKPIFDFFSGEMRAALLPSPSFSVKGLTLQEGLTPGGQRKRTELIGSECKGKWYCFCCGDLVFACIRRVETLFDKIGCLFFSQFCTTIAAQSYIISDLYSRKNHTVLSLLSLFIPTSRKCGRSENVILGKKRKKIVCGVVKVVASAIPKTVIEIQYHCNYSSRYPTVKLSVSGIIKFSSISGFLTCGIRGKCLISSISGFLTVYKVRHGEESARESTREKRGKKQKHWWEKILNFWRTKWFSSISGL